MAHLVDHRRAQRARGNDRAIAEAAPGVERDQRIVEIDLPALEAVIHDDKVDAVFQELSCPGRAIARHDCRRDTRQQQRLVANRTRRVMFQVDKMRTGMRAAIAARQEARRIAFLPDRLRDGDGRRRLARTADGEIADAHDRRHDLERLGVIHPPARGGAVYPAQGCQAIGRPALLTEPERRRLTSSQVRSFERVRRPTCWTMDGIRGRRCAGPPARVKGGYRDQAPARSG